MLNKINCQAAWSGSELFRRDDWQHTFTSDDLRELDVALGQVTSTPIAEITQSDFHLPTLGMRLRAIQESLEHGSGAVIVRGFPVDRYTEQQSESIFWGLATHLGTAMPQTAHGDRLFHVRDEGFADDHPQARGPSSSKRLSFHTDRCDVIAFMCLRPAIEGGENFVVSSVTLFNLLLERRPDLLDVLMQPYAYKRHNVDTGNRLPYYEQPIFSIYRGHFAAQLLRVLIERAYQMPDLPDMSAKQREALDYVEELAEDESVHARFYQQPGDIVLLNNLVTFHRRSEFRDSPDPKTQRHLLRIWLSVPNSRPLDPVFAASLGDTEAGALRGGMRPS